MTPSDTPIPADDANVGTGWHALLSTLQACVDAHIAATPECPPVRVWKIKEKLGGLRYQCTGGDEHIRGMIVLAEAMSLKTCEICGQSGTLLTEGGLRTRCLTHRDTLVD